nr:hypothetical protein [uncultured Treponema sp.]
MDGCRYIILNFLNKILLSSKFPVEIKKEGFRKHHAREEGLISNILFSFHDEPSSIKHIIDGAGKYGVPMESLLVQYNILDRSNEEMLAYALAFLCKRWQAILASYLPSSLNGSPFKPQEVISA